MEEINKRKLCYSILTCITVLIGLDIDQLTDKNIILMIKKLEELSNKQLLELSNILYTIYCEHYIKEE